MIYLYRSQWDADANQRRNDCGPACVAMVLQAFGQYVDINELSLIDAGDDGTTAAELIALLARRGIEARQTATPSAPAICLVKYAGFKRAGVQDTNFTGWHWLILLGGDESQVVVHDPDWWGSRRSEGANHVFSRVEWDAAFIPYGESRIAITWKEIETMSKVRVTSGTQSYDLDMPITLSDVPAATNDVWQANFYNGMTPGGTPLYTTTYPGPALNLNWADKSPAAAVPVDNFSAVFSMTHVFAAGTYQWTVNSDDGFQLLVDGVVVPGLDGWIEQSADSKTYTGHVTLTAGTHTITVRYFEKGGLASLKVSAPSPF